MKISRNGVVVIDTTRRPDDDPPPATTSAPARWANDPLEDLVPARRAA